MTDRDAEFARKIRALRAERLRLEREVANMETERLVSDVIARVLVEELLKGSPD